MIKLKSLLLEYHQATIEITKRKFIQLFNKNCKNIKNINEIVFRGIYEGQDNYIFFKNQTIQIRLSSQYNNAFYNNYFSKSED